MYNKVIRNKLKLCVGMLLCAVAVLSTPIASIITYAADPGDIEVCADYKQWVYKIIGDKMYKALFNNSTGRYETDWIYVCDWPEGLD